MNFGEIIEPSSRALIEDELEEYPDYVRENFDWTGAPEPPTDLTALIFAESGKVLKVFAQCVLHEATLVAQLKENCLKIYKTTPGTYVVCYEESSLFTTGEIVEELKEWLAKAVKIVTITSAPLATYQTTEKINNSTCSVLRGLSTGINAVAPPKRLEAPNLLTGLGANVLSYCLCVGLNCTSCVAYMDCTPLDSMNTRELINLAQSLQLNPKPFGGRTVLINSNLYM